MFFVLLSCDSYIRLPHLFSLVNNFFYFFEILFFCHTFLSVWTSVVFAASLSDECYSIMPLSNCQYFLYFLFYLYNWHNLSSHSYHFLSTFLKRLTWNKIFALIRHSCSFYPICYCKGYVNTFKTIDKQPPFVLLYII